MKEIIMSNSITERMESGKVGELLVQIRLLQFGVQAAPPVIDSGNDLIAVREFVYKSIQVKSTSGDTFNKPDGECLYHLLAVVLLNGNDYEYLLDSSPIYLIPKNIVDERPGNYNHFTEYLLTQELIDHYFQS